MAGMGIRMWCGAALALGWASGTQAQTPDAAVNQAIALVKERALNARKVDWPTVEAEAIRLSVAAPGEAGRTDAIRHVLKSLRDGHSFYQPPQPGAASPSVRTVEAPPAPRVVPPPIAVTRTGGRFAQLTIHAWSGTRTDIPAATTNVREALNRALSHQTCGLIIDVAGNTGGNMWPMMGGIAPLYGAGTLETFEDRDGGRETVNVADGWLRMNENVWPQAPAMPPVVASPRHIAVILGGQTASSGEILALGFKGQANVRFFGQPTAGATTANWSTRLTNGGLIAITTSRILDRAGKVHTGPVMPDERSDQPHEAATRWLATKCR